MHPRVGQKRVQLVIQRLRRSCEPPKLGPAVTELIFLINIVVMPPGLESAVLPGCGSL